jgi:hypothetical protein
VLTIAGSAASTGSLLRRLGLTFAAVMRAGVVLPVVPFGLLAAPSRDRLAMAGVGALVLGWSVVEVRSMLATPPDWLFPADVAVVCLAALAQPWTTPDTAFVNGGTGWGLVFVSLSMLGWQLHVPLRTAAVAWACVMAAMLAGGLLAPAGLTIGYGFSLVWITIESLLTRLLWHLVWQASVRADQAISAAEAAREESEVAAARRAEERSYAATVHDTVASTLLMVGLGEARRGTSWLQSQARRDLETLSGDDASWLPRGPGRPGAPALPSLLAQAAQEHPELQVSLHAIPQLELDGPLAEAVFGAVREALTNASRHAGVTHVEVRCQLGDGTAVLEVADAGRGFHTDDVPPARRGLGQSIVGRMRSVGGNAAVTSGPGHGTCVRLEWPR